MRRSMFRLLGFAAVIAGCGGEAAAPSTTEPDASAAEDAGGAGERDAAGDLDAHTAAGDLGRPTATDAPPPTIDPGRPAAPDVPAAGDLGRALDAPAPDAGTPVAPAPIRRVHPPIGQVMRRVVHARAFQHLRWTIDHETPEAVGRALASLRPTYVSGLVRVANDEMLSPAQVRNFDTIRRIVREASPECVFDVVLNGQQYETPAAMRNKMRAVDEALGPDAWFFDFFYSAYTHGFRNPLDASVEWAHEHRQYIGGNTTGDQSVPRSDFAALSPVSHAGMVADGTLDLKRDEILRLHQRGFPVLMHINNDPHFAPTTESCYFMGASGIARFDWGYHRRVQWITERARDQSDWHFHFMYPVYFPECPIWHSYNAPRDGMMMDVFADLVRRFN